eukprot:TRINITY_DN9649_c0_g1::TRINITY_DN9649_c0_g1_i1::g.10139::m.10139 TRINITY_DN9649_c0_g1::TRINITY_DN9649_c0_g1_i1::g.10139  ORF type:complete len:268 (-),score=13.55,sp/Q8LB60/CCU31_ARATH/31.20/2e-06,Cyclin/PF08613.6/3.1e-08,Cyclin_N/PF00134.18/0.00035,Spy1/PF11357.3/0.022,FAP/PF07174.6/4.3,FAP/PF07174.6/2.4e+02 TRINITY_DN9649_c0_g1_i1:87-890(-)
MAPLHRLSIDVESVRIREPQMSVLSNPIQCSRLVSSLLEQLTDWSFPTLDEPTLRYYGLIFDPFQMSMAFWIDRLLNFVSEPELLAALIYALRALGIPPKDAFHMKSTKGLNQYNRHRIIFTATMVANKFFRDDSYNNAKWAKIALGSRTYWTKRRITTFERQLLGRLDWKLYITNEEFDDFVSAADHYMLTHLPVLTSPMSCPGTPAGLSRTVSPQSPFIPEAPSPCNPSAKSPMMKIDPTDSTVMEISPRDRPPTTRILPPILRK